MEKYQFSSVNGNCYILSWKDGSEITNRRKPLSVEPAGEGPCEETKVSVHICETTTNGSLESEATTDVLWGLHGPSLENICDLRHENILRYYGFGEITASESKIILPDDCGNLRFSGNLFCILTEKGPGEVPTLSTFSKEKIRSTEQILSFTTQLLKGLEFLHTRKPEIIIGNMNSRSILVTAEGTSVKICGREFREDNPTVWKCTDALPFCKLYEQKFLFPKLNAVIFLQLQLDLVTFWSEIKPCADIWSLGCVVLDMLTNGRIQLITKDDAPLTSNIDCGSIARVMLDGGKPQIPADAPTILKRLCLHCFKREPQCQTSARELLNILEVEKEIFVADNKPLKFYTFISTDTSSFEFKIADCLGKGSFGEVYQIDIKETTNPNLTIPLALKAMNSSQEIVEKRKRILLSLENVNIVRYIAFGKILPKLYHQFEYAILMECCAGGTLKAKAMETLKKFPNKKETLNEKKIIEYTLQITKGIEYLHERKPHPIFHGDLKGENIFLSADEETVKIGDLDDCDIYKTDKTKPCSLFSDKSTIWFMSPEVLKFAINNANAINTKICKESDIWSIGCTALEMIGKGQVYYMDKQNKEIPQNTKPIDLWKKLMDGKGISPYLSPGKTRNISEKFREIIKQCLKIDPKERLRASELRSALTAIV